MSAKSVSVAFLFLALIVFVSTKLFNQPTYSIKDIEKKPIPKKYLFELINPITFVCSEPRIFELTEDQCKQHVNKKLESCKEKLMQNTPETIETKTQLKQIWESYSNCVAPDIIISAKPLTNPSSGTR